MILIRSLLLFACLSVGMHAWAAPGDLDTSFGSGGKVNRPMGAGNREEGHSVALQSDGKIVVAGEFINPTTSKSEIAVVRYHANGMLDATFDSDGSVTLNIGDANGRQSVAVQGDGKIVVAGTVYTSAKGYFLGMARYNTDGSLDTGFNAGGTVSAEFGDRDFIHALAIQSDGKIVLSGSSSENDPERTLLARFNVNGTLDASFGGTGWVTASIGTGSIEARSVVVQADKKIIIAGQVAIGDGSSSDFALLRYHGNGTLDTSFGTAGKVTTSIGGVDAGNSVKVQSDGKIVVTGMSSSNGSTYDVVLVRYLANGSLDTTFGSGGKVITAIGSGDEYGRSLALQTDGKIVVGGQTDTGSTTDFAVLRYNVNGSLDSSFGGDGKVVTEVSFYDECYGVAVQPDGKILAVGNCSSSLGNDIVLVRYTISGGLDPGFGTGGTVTTDIPRSYDDFGRGVAVQSDDKIVVAGYSATGKNYDFSVVRYLASGASDTNFGTAGKVTTSLGSGDDRGYAVAVQSDGKIVVAGDTDRAGGNRDIALVRYTASGSLDSGFGASGKTIIAISSDNEYGRAVALQADGKILVVGATWNGSNYDFALVRVNAVGSSDSSFGTNGRVTTAIGSGLDYALSLVVQGDGRIVVSGYTFTNGNGYALALVRYHANGSLDTSFGGDGKVTTAMGGYEDYGNSVTLQSDGKIIVAGAARRLVSGHSGDFDFALVRYQTDGSLDTTFGSGGKVLTDLSTGGDDKAYSVKVLGDGKILVAGTAPKADLNDMALVRYLANGNLDTTFGSGGKVITNMGSIPNLDVAYGLGLQSSGRAIIGGSATAGYPTGASKTNFALAAYVNPLAPAVSTLASTQVFGTTARVAGLVNPRGNITTAYFQYGLTTSYGKSVSVAVSPNNGLVDQPVSATLTGLTPNSLYHYRIAANNAAGTTNGADGTFTTTAASGDATLTSLVPSMGTMTPAFAPDVLDYTASVSQLVTSATVRPAAAHGNAVMRVNGILVASGSSSQVIPLPAGSTTITTVVTAENGSTQTYRLVISRPVSTIVALSTLTLSAGTLSPAFIPGTLNYTASVGHATSAVTVTSTAHAYATVKINGTTATAAGVAVPLVYGGNPITVEVTAEDAVSKVNYTLVVTRPVPVPEIALSVYGAAAVEDGGMLPFGDVGLGGQRSTLLLIANDGTADLTGLTATLDGPHAGMFRLVPPPGAVAPGSSAGLLLEYVPTARGEHLAFLHVTSNDDDESPYDITLTGMGVPPVTVSPRALPATEITFDSAILNGLMAANGEGETLFFDYGTIAAGYEASTEAWPNGMDTSGRIMIISGVSGLQPHTKYQYRLRTIGPRGSFSSAGLTFVTGNRPPEPVSDTFKLVPGTVIAVDVLANDWDPDGDTLSLASVSALPASSGRATIVNNQLIVNAADTFDGVSFDYAVKDIFGGRGTATVTLMVGSSTIMPAEKEMNSAGGSYPIYVAALESWWSVNGMPSWVSAAPVSDSGSGVAQINVKPNLGRASRSATIMVAGKPHVITQAGVLRPDISMPLPVPAAMVGVDFTMTIPTTNAPVAYLVTTPALAAYRFMSLPPGLAINHTTGVISGRPTRAGTYPLVITARNQAGTSPTTLRFDLTVTALPQGVVGTYHGYIGGDAVLNGLIGSRFEMTTTATGMVTGKIITGVAAKSFTGRLNASALTPTLATFTYPALNLALTLDATTQTLTSTAPALPVTAWRQVWKAVTNPATVYKGLHTFFLTSPTAEQEVPQGYGFGSFTVDEKTGALKVSGKLADGSALLMTTFLGPQGQVLIYQPLYANKGSFGGVLTVAVDHDVTGAPIWYKPVVFGPAEITAEGAAYTAPAAGNVVMGLPDTANNARINFTLGGLETEGREFGITFSLLNPGAPGVGLTNKATFPLFASGNNPNKVAMPTVTPATGLFSGEFTIPGVTPAKNRKVACYGQITGAQGYGFFLLPDPVNATIKRSGRVVLGSP